MHKPYCKRCHHPVDDQDLEIIAAHIDPYGELWIRLLCNWCGHQWQRSAKGCERMRGYKQAVAQAYQGLDRRSIIHQ